MVENVESILARIAVTLILSATLLASTLGAWMRRLIKGSRTVGSDRPIDVVIIGTFYNDGWFRSHIVPLIECNEIGRVFVVCDAPLESNAKVSYHCPSRLLRKCMGRTLARLVVLADLACRKRPAMLMGYHIMPNALLALLVARWFGMLAAYQMTGGPVQLLGGGVGSENTLLRRQKKPSRLRQALMFALARRFDRIVVRGESARRFICEIAPHVHCDVIPGSIDAERLDVEDFEKSYDIIAVGRLVDVKRYDRMLAIIAELKRVRPGLRAAIVGDGPLMKALADQTESLGLAANVDFTGQRKDVPALLAKARLFLMTSENEGLSIAMMEAMAAGLPAVVPRVGDLPDLVVDGETGLIVDPNDAVQTACRIGALLENAEALKRMARSARAKAITHADVSRVSARWTAMVSSIRREQANLPVLSRTAFTVFGAALAVRLLFCLVAVPLFQLQTGPLQPDFFTSTDGYVNIATTLVDHGKFAFTQDAAPTTYRAPMFPLSLAAIYALVGNAGTAVLIVNCLTSALTCVVVYFMAVRLVSKRASFLFLTPAILFPLSIYYCASSFSDTFFAFAVSLYVLTLIRLVQSPNQQSGVLHGIAFAFAVLTKAVVLPLPLFVGAFAIIRHRPMVRPLVIATLVGISGIGIWTARNYAATNRFVLVTGGSGYNALIGNFMIDEWTDCDTALSHGRKRALTWIREHEGVEIKTRDLRPTNFLDVPAEIDRLYGRSAAKMLAESPVLALRKLAVNAVRFWYFSSGPTKSLANGIVNGLVLLLALGALPELLRTRRREAEIIGLIVAAFVVLYSLIIVHSSRFCLPMVMVMTPLASMGISRLARLFLSERAASSTLQRA